MSHERITTDAAPAPRPTATTADRVLEFTEARGLLAELALDTDNLHTGLTSKLNGTGEALDHVLDVLHADAVNRWRKGAAILPADQYEAMRRHAIARLDTLHRRATAAAEHASALSRLLHALDAMPTEDDLAADITSTARQFYEGGWSTDTEAQVDLMELWWHLARSPLVGDDALMRLRRRFDEAITYPYPGDRMPDLVDAVTRWRSEHLNALAAAGAMGVDDWAYVIATARTWADLDTAWHVIADPDSPVYGAENVRLRTTIARKVVQAQITHEQGLPERLVGAVNRFNTSSTTLGQRIRHAATLADLAAVSDVLAGRSRDADDTLALMRLHNCRFDKLRAAWEASDDTSDDEYMAERMLADRVDRWRNDVFESALNAASNPGYCDEDTRYNVMFYAVSEARDIGADARIAQLLGLADRAATEGLLTTDHHKNLHTLAPLRGERLDLNGGDQ